jgi:hypothetical protein
VFLRQGCLKETTHKFIDLKRRYFPRIVSPGTHRLSHILAEVKGAEIRRNAIAGSRRRRRHALGFLDHCIQLLESQDARIVSRIYIKGIAAEFDGRAVYTSAMQSICRTFQSCLHVQGDEGLVIADSRNKPKNATVSFSIFTQKFKHRGDEYERLLEMPTFGHSENHAGIQLADLLCSALLFPMATATYCYGHVTSVHVRAEYSNLKTRFGARLKALQYRYQDDGHRWRGGVTVCDAIGHRSSSHMFR